MKKYHLLIIAVILAVVALFVNSKIEDRENKAMKNFASAVSNERDRNFETEVAPLIQKIKNDSLINVWAAKQCFPSDDSLLSYLDKNYFDIQALNYYSRVATLCTVQTYLTIESTDAELLCGEYFFNILNTNLIRNIDGNLIHIDDPTTDVYYISSLDFPNNQTLFIEFYKERVFDNSIVKDLKNYSFGIYKNDILDYKYGYYLYPNNLNNFATQEAGIFKGNHFKHYLYKNPDNNKTVVVSVESERWVRLVAAFSLIFFALLLSYYIYLYLQNGRTRIFKKSFHGRIQLTILLTLAFAFLAVGVTSFIFLRNNFTQKTQISQYKQAIIIRNRLEINLESENSLTNQDYINDIKESFLCDINIYNLDGILINTTLDDYFINIESQTIDFNAFNAIYTENAGYFTQTEYYGNERCVSYYFPILDKNNELVGIMNIPYFDSNSEYDDRISSFVFTYINIIFILLCISSAVVLLITRNTLKPLKMIQDEMAKLNFGVDNKPIPWTSNDEIGALIEQYNKMRWQLENAANRIARNERENAWREMARQVAHEIKNPLTPMRLNIEYLQMLWDRKDPNFEKSLKETLQSLLEQIETLSSIATAYSNYAKLPDNSPVSFDLGELLKSTVKLYDVEKNISIVLIYDENQSWTMFADKNNLGRVFGNIIKNAIQAIGSSKIGHIEVILSSLGERYKIKISDNGCGIKESDKAKVFFPNFTTKSSGMGVGLSVSQDIVQGMGGNITVASQEGIGTVFTIDLPILKEK
ncbi:MAG: HAMP domain-containing sensor histidine kinase [Bacteroidales bacterium]|nr:HAMP domain-containing sensor histidine kinase [Bacteroidales bacterium]